MWKTNGKPLFMGCLSGFDCGLWKTLKKSAKNCGKMVISYLYLYR